MKDEQAMNRDYCECPYCRRNFPLMWCWEATKFAYLDDTDGEVVTDRDCLDATRVVHMTRHRCPNCGRRLIVSHTLAPRFYAFEEGDHGER